MSEALVSHLAHNETNIFRQRTIGVPARDYVPILRAWDRMLDSIASMFNIQYGRDKHTENAKEYRRLQEIYTDDLLAGLRERINNGDETPSILGNIMRNGSLKDEDIVLASYTGSPYHASRFNALHARSPFVWTASSGVNLGYSLTWLTGYLANHSEVHYLTYRFELMTEIRYRCKRRHITPFRRFTKGLFLTLTSLIALNTSRHFTL